MSASQLLIKILSLVSLCLLMVWPLCAGSPRYRIIDLTERAPVRQSEARSVNERGEVVGFELLPDYQAQAVYWDAEQNGYLLPRLEGDNSNTAYSINDSGLITGVSELVTIERIGRIKRIYFDSKASLWKDGLITELSALAHDGDDLQLERATAANARGVITGTAKGPGENERRGFVFDDGVVTEMRGFSERVRAVYPYAINASGLVVGEFSPGNTHAFLWDNGQATDLHAHPSLQGVTSRAFSINDAGQIVGEAQFLLSHPESPVLWQDGVPINLVGERFRRPQGIAMSINNAGQIIGFVKDLDDLSSPFEGFLIEKGQYRRLLDLIPPDQGWDALLVPWHINDAGWIVGGGMRNGQLGHAWLMIPNTEDGDRN